ncbi:MAG TPA: GTP 3',8-cyclase MoaA [Xanthomonadaceae bacterium]|nr:GTP 3',8-cyclase MoaA [Xanthomonadaceae bacterium]
MPAIAPGPLPLDAPLPLDRLGRPLHDLRLSVIDRCNFRCPYCMPAGAPLPDTDSRGRLSRAEIVRLVQAFVRLGATRVRLTGGEPLLRRDLPRIVSAVAAIDGIADLALTTNGQLLSRQAGALRRAGLGRLSVSLDALDPAVFARMSGSRGSVHEVLAGIDAAADAGFAPIKINCVVQRGVNEDQALPLVAHFRNSGHVVRFIEYMDVGSCNGWRREQVVPAAELRERIHARYGLLPLSARHRGEVARRYALADGSGEVGFITAISEPFCGDCSRARVSAAGELFTCLFATRGTPLRHLLAHDAQYASLCTAIAGHWHARADRYSEQRAAGDRRAIAARVEMYRIGG